MKILGISPLDKDATASLVEDGEILFAAGEERFTRNKQQDGFPLKAIEAALSFTNTRIKEIDKVVYPFLEFQNEMKLIQKNLEDEKKFISSFDRTDLKKLLSKAGNKIPKRTAHIHGLTLPNEKVEKGILYDTFYNLAGSQAGISGKAALKGSRNWAEQARVSFTRWQDDLELGLEQIGLADKLRRMDHHLSHAANAYHASGFENALCITLDGYGSGLAGTVSEAKSGKIHRLHSVSYPNSLGTMYEHVTSSLGFKPGRHEGKIVGLASYGDPEILSSVLLRRIEQAPGDFKIFEANNIYFSRYLASHFPKIDVAAAYQQVLEVVAGNFVKYWIDKTGMDTVVLSGGVTANVKLNQRIFELEGVRQIFIYPNMGDGGCGTGAALYHTYTGEVKPSITNSYFGPDYGDEEITKELKIAGLDFTKPDHLAKVVAEHIHSGKVVARFDGRMEYGPRALGNRSILYHAREPEVNQWLNKKLGRTEFMPFAPVTLFEERNRYYRNVEGAAHAAEFMTITFDCTDEMKLDCPAAVHIDGTARPQLIKRETNPGYYDILKEYEKLSGISSLINTSFNMHEEPIVCTPFDAIRAFLQGNLDILAIGPFLVEQPGQPKNR